MLLVIINCSRLASKRKANNMSQPLEGFSICLFYQDILCNLFTSSGTRSWKGQSFWKIWTQAGMSGNVPCYLTVHDICCLPVSDGGSFPTPFSLLLGSSDTTKACLAEWQAQGSQKCCHHPLSTFISLPSFPHHRMTWWRCAVDTRCGGGPGELISSTGEWCGCQNRPFSVLPVPRDVRTCHALWLTSVSHFPQQSMFPASLGRPSVGTVPVSLPFQSFAFLSQIWLFLWAQCKDASKERKPLMPQQFIKKKRRLLNLEAVESVVLFSSSRR